MHPQYTRLVTGIQAGPCGPQPHSESRHLLVKEAAAIDRRYLVRTEVDIRNFELCGGHESPSFPAGSNPGVIPSGRSHPSRI
jgi:hypothetical protein